MQFIKNGPDIPERLLQQHEEGRVVFFCGAGISYPAGLPGFGDLVAVHNNTVVTDPFKGGRLNKLSPIYQDNRIPEMYNFLATDITWETYRPRAKMKALDRIYPEGIKIHPFFKGRIIFI